MKFGIIPALWCLRDSLTIAGVVSRTKKELSFFEGKLQLSTSPLSDIRMHDIDLNIVAVSTHEVAGVLKQLSLFDTKGITLMLDTPVLSAYHLLAARFFKRFKRVCVTEDSIALPPFVLAQKILDSGEVGAVRHVHFAHNAFRYHALAGLRLFLGAPRLITASKHRKVFRFERGVAILDEPMSPNGTFLIEGEKGSIADFDHPGAKRISYEKEDGMYRGLVLDGKKVPHSANDALYAAINRSVFDGANETISSYAFLNSMKIRALIDLIPAALAGTAPMYRPEDALFDALAITIAEKIGWFDSRAPLFPALRLLAGSH
ncbi:MAG TPA: hypothetical protein VGQ55_00535 [Pyrinomonadaceae bacterium]|nr:hypothetical protein [Pyrinomonadaceae bacterium]